MCERRDRMKKNKTDKYKFSKMELLPGEKIAFKDTTLEHQVTNE